MQAARFQGQGGVSGDSSPALSVLSSGVVSSQEATGPVRLLNSPERRKKLQGGREARVGRVPGLGGSSALGGVLAYGGASTSRLGRILHAAADSPSASRGSGVGNREWTGESGYSENSITREFSPSPVVKGPSGNSGEGESVRFYEAGREAASARLSVLPAGCASTFVDGSGLTAFLFTNDVYHVRGACVGARGKGLGLDSAGDTSFPQQRGPGRPGAGDAAGDAGEAEGARDLVGPPDVIGEGQGDLDPQSRMRSSLTVSQLLGPPQPLQQLGRPGGASAEGLVSDTGDRGGRSSANGNIRAPTHLASYASTDSARATMALLLDRWASPRVSPAIYCASGLECDQGELSGPDATFLIGSSQRLDPRVSEGSAHVFVLLAREVSDPSLGGRSGHAGGSLCPTSRLSLYLDEAETCFTTIFDQEIVRGVRLIRSYAGDAAARPGRAAGVEVGGEGESEAHGNSDAVLRQPNNEKEAAPTAERQGALPRILPGPGVANASGVSDAVIAAQSAPAGYHKAGGSLQTLSRGFSRDPALESGSTHAIQGFISGDVEAMLWARSGAFYVVHAHLVLFPEKGSPAGSNRRNQATDGDSCSLKVIAAFDNYRQFANSILISRGRSRGTPLFYSVCKLVSLSPETRTPLVFPPGFSVGADGLFPCRDVCMLFRNGALLQLDSGELCGFHVLAQRASLSSSATAQTRFTSLAAVGTIFLAVGTSDGEVQLWRYSLSQKAQERCVLSVCLCDYSYQHGSGCLLSAREERDTLAGGIAGRRPDAPENLRGSVLEILPVFVPPASDADKAADLALLVTTPAGVYVVQVLREQSEGKAGSVIAAVKADEAGRASKGVPDVATSAEAGAAVAENASGVHTSTGEQVQTRLKLAPHLVIDAATLYLGKKHDGMSSRPVPGLRRAVPLLANRVCDSLACEFDDGVWRLCSLRTPLLHFSLAPPTIPLAFLGFSSRPRLPGAKAGSLGEGRIGAGVDSRSLISEEDFFQEATGIVFSALLPFLSDTQLFSSQYATPATLGRDFTGELRDPPRLEESLADAGAGGGAGTGGEGQGVAEGVAGSAGVQPGVSSQLGSLVARSAKAEGAANAVPAEQVAVRQRKRSIPRKAVEALALGANSGSDTFSRSRKRGASESKQDFKFTRVLIGHGMRPGTRSVSQSWARRNTPNQLPVGSGTIVDLQFDPRDAYMQKFVINSTPDGQVFARGFDDMIYKSRALKGTALGYLVGEARRNNFWGVTFFSGPSFGRGLAQTARLPTAEGLARRHSMTFVDLNTGTTDRPGASRVGERDAANEVTTSTAAPALADTQPSHAARPAAVISAALDETQKDAQGALEGDASTFGLGGTQGSPGGATGQTVLAGQSVSPGSRAAASGQSSPSRASKLLMDGSLLTADLSPVRSQAGSGLRSPESPPFSRGSGFRSGQTSSALNLSAFLSPRAHGSYRLGDYEFPELARYLEEERPDGGSLIVMGSRMPTRAPSRGISAVARALGAQSENPMGAKDEGPGVYVVKMDTLGRFVPHKLDKDPVNASEKQNVVSVLGKYSEAALRMDAMRYRLREIYGDKVFALMRGDDPMASPRRKTIKEKYQEIFGDDSPGRYMATLLERNRRLRDEAERAGPQKSAIESQIEEMNMREHAHMEVFEAEKREAQRLAQESVWSRTSSRASSLGRKPKSSINDSWSDAERDALAASRGRSPTPHGPSSPLARSRRAGEYSQGSPPSSRRASPRSSVERPPSPHGASRIDDHADDSLTSPHRSLGYGESPEAGDRGGRVSVPADPLFKSPDRSFFDTLSPGGTPRGRRGRGGIDDYLRDGSRSSKGSSPGHGSSLHSPLRRGGGVDDSAGPDWRKRLASGEGVDSESWRPPPYSIHDLSKDAWYQSLTDEEKLAWLLNERVPTGENYISRDTMDCPLRKPYLDDSFTWGDEVVHVELGPEYLLSPARIAELEAAKAEKEKAAKKKAAGGSQAAGPTPQSPRKRTQRPRETQVPPAISENEQHLEAYLAYYGTVARSNREIRASEYYPTSISALTGNFFRPSVADVESYSTFTTDLARRDVDVWSFDNPIPPRRVKSFSDLLAVVELFSGRNKNEAEAGSREEDSSSSQSSDIHVSVSRVSAGIAAPVSRSSPLRASVAAKDSAVVPSPIPISITNMAIPSSAGADRPGRFAPPKFSTAVESVREGYTGAAGIRGDGWSPVCDPGDFLTEIFSSRLEKRERTELCEVASAVSREAMASSAILRVSPGELVAELSRGERCGELLAGGFDQLFQRDRSEARLRSREVRGMLSKVLPYDVSFSVAGLAPGQSILLNGALVELGSLMPKDFLAYQVQQNLTRRERREAKLGGEVGAAVAIAKSESAAENDDIELFSDEASQRARPAPDRALLPFKNCPTPEESQRQALGLWAALYPAFHSSLTDPVLCRRANYTPMACLERDLVFYLEERYLDAREALRSEREAETRRGDETAGMVGQAASDGSAPGSPGSPRHLEPPASRDLVVLSSTPASPGSPVELTRSAVFSDHVLDNEYFVQEIEERRRAIPATLWHRAEALRAALGAEGRPGRKSPLLVASLKPGVQGVDSGESPGGLGRYKVPHADSQSPGGSKRLRESVLAFSQAPSQVASRESSRATSRNTSRAGSREPSVADSSLARSTQLTPRRRFGSPERFSRGGRLAAFRGGGALSSAMPRSRSTRDANSAFRMLYRRSANELYSAIVEYGNSCAIGAKYKRRNFSLGLCSQKAFFYQVLYECMVTLPREARFVARQVQKQCADFDPRELQFIPLTALCMLSAYSQARDVMVFLRHHLRGALQRKGVILKGANVEAGENAVAEVTGGGLGASRRTGLRASLGASVGVSPSASRSRGGVVVTEVSAATPTREGPPQPSEFQSDGRFEADHHYNLDVYSSRPGLPLLEVPRESQHLTPRGGWGPRVQHGALLDGPPLRIPSFLYPEARPESNTETLEAERLAIVEKLYNTCTYLLLALRPATVEVREMIAWRLRMISRRDKLSKLPQGGDEDVGRQYADICLSLSVASKMEEALRFSEHYEAEAERFCFSGRETVVKPGGSAVVMLKNAPGQAEQALARQNLLPLWAETKLNTYQCLQALGYSFVPPGSLPRRHVSVLPWGVAASLKAVTDVARGTEEPEWMQITQQFALEKTALVAMTTLLQHFRRKVPRRPFSTLFTDAQGTLGKLYPGILAYGSDGEESESTEDVLEATRPSSRDRHRHPSFNFAAYEIVLTEMKLRLDNNYIVGYSVLVDTVGVDAAEQLSLWFEKSYAPVFVTERAIERRQAASRGAPAVESEWERDKVSGLPSEAEQEDLLAVPRFSVSRGSSARGQRNSGPEALDGRLASPKNAFLDRSPRVGAVLAAQSPPSAGAVERAGHDGPIALAARSHARLENRPAVRSGNPAFVSDPYISAVQGLTSPQRSGSRGFAKAFERDYVELEPEKPAPNIDEHFQIMVKTGDLDAARRRLDGLMQEILTSGPPGPERPAPVEDGVSQEGQGFIPPLTEAERERESEAALGKGVLDLSVSMLTKRVIGLRAALEGPEFGSGRSPPRLPHAREAGAVYSSAEPASALAPPGSRALLEDSERTVADFRHGMAVLRLQMKSPALWAEKAQTLSSREGADAERLKAEAARRHTSRLEGVSSRHILTDQRGGGSGVHSPRPGLSPSGAERQKSVAPLSYTLSSKQKPGRGFAERDRSISSFLPEEAGISRGAAYTVRRLMTPTPDEIDPAPRQSGDRDRASKAK